MTRRKSGHLRPGPTDAQATRAGKPGLSDGFCSTQGAGRDTRPVAAIGVSRQPQRAGGAATPRTQQPEPGHPGRGPQRSEDRSPGEDRSAARTGAPFQKRGPPGGRTADPPQRSRPRPFKGGRVCPIPTAAEERGGERRRSGTRADPERWNQRWIVRQRSRTRAQRGPERSEDRSPHRQGLKSQNCEISGCARALPGSNTAPPCRWTFPTFAPVAPGGRILHR